MVTAMDEAVKKVMTALRKYKLTQNLLVVFTSDVSNFSLTLLLQRYRTTKSERHNSIIRNYFLITCLHLGTWHLHFLTSVIKELIEKSREGHNQKRHQTPDTKRKRKSTKLNACKINKHMAGEAHRPAPSSTSEVITMLKGLKKHDDKEWGMAKHEARRSINHKATLNKNNSLLLHVFSMATRVDYKTCETIIMKTLSQLIKNLIYNLEWWGVICGRQQLATTGLQNNTVGRWHQGPSVRL